MYIMDIWVSQRKLQRFHQVREMVNTLYIGGLLPKITLICCEDGCIQVQDGHHRLMAYWLSGRLELEPHEYILIQKDQDRPRFGKITSIWHSCVG